ncbi:DEAD/DEAH box helicase [Sedimentitalea sp. JM2-8]|uniref:DEAD/DEAH box helicase n=1 Tax=Sedimentitalea xiamensis TaxID=3050037 RepID=A0ABT7FGK4_9RHOB|nr:DEAD/DEAH box helicase [Sedimentitalea xiamensis]MDK3074243.1 DEAD/DEAH box helicase [Sedimentitalea xiamensis]
MKQTLADALAQQGYATLTQVQQAVTDPELAGSDLLVSAQTGSGKTVGFGLAIAPTILGDGDHFASAAAPLALIIAPTRELALQVKRELAWLYGRAGAHLASCVGGMDIRDERRALERGAHIVVATPGRLRDHVMRGSIDLSDIKAIVLDEADEMLDLGFQEDLEFILAAAPEDRRTLMFSATVPRGIANLAGKYQTDAIRITTAAETSQHSDIEYRALSVAPRDVDNAIVNVLRFYEAPNALVFANTRAMVNRLTTRLSNRGFSVVALSGELSQSERTHALQAMRDGRARVCVATDVAARGIDLPSLDLVVHAELPTSHETLLHRSGRTGRAGRKGVSALIVPPAARKKCERLLKFAKLTAEWAEAPSADAVRARDMDRMLADPVWHAPIELTDAAQALVARFSAEQIAAAYVALYESRHSAPEELLAPGPAGKPEPRAPFGPSVWFSVAGGKKAGIETRRLLPILCKAGNISKDDIGAIRIHYDESYVEILESSADRFLAALGPDMTVEGDARVTRLDRTPDLGGSSKPGAKPFARSPEHRRGPGRKETGPDRIAPRPAPQPEPPGPERRKPSAPPSPRPRKPEPGSAAGKRAPMPDIATADGLVSPAKRRGKPAAHNQAGKRKPKAPGQAPSKAPPVGKPNSKKNKARAAAAKARGGDKPPKRRAPKT